MKAIRWWFRRVLSLLLGGLLLIVLTFIGFSCIPNVPAFAWAAFALAEGLIAGCIILLQTNKYAQKDVSAHQSCQELRRQRDEELAKNRPFPLISLAEWQARSRKIWYPVTPLILGILGVILGPIWLFAYLELPPWIIPIWCIMCAFLVRWPFSPAMKLLNNRIGLACPYCREDLAPALPWVTRKRLRRDPGLTWDDLGRCPKCQRIILSDWTKEKGWEKVSLLG
jgi:hypothetical protein